MEKLLVWTKKIAVFMILSGYMGYLLPKQYRRYFRMCTGMLLIMMLMSPLVQFLRDSAGWDIEYLQQALQLEDQKTFFSEDESDDYQAYYLQQYEQAMQERLVQIIRDNGAILKTVKMKINENDKEEGYGTVERIDLSVEGIDTDMANTVKNQISENFGIDKKYIHLELKDSQ